MATETGRGFCKDCKKKVLVTRNKPGEFGHFLLTVLTLGLWSPIWIIAMLFPPPFRCSICGKTTRKYFFS